MDNVNKTNTIKTQVFFAKHSVFASDEFSEFLGKREKRNKRIQESTLAYYTRKGRILRVRRGLYVVVPPGVEPDKCPVDPYLLAGKMTDDAVLAYHTAMEGHGKAYSVYERFVYLTNRTSRPANFRSYQFHGVKFPKALCEKYQETFGVKEVERAGINIHITSLERTMVDVLDRPDLAGSWEEIWRSLESVEFFNIDEVVEYTLLLENATTVSKVGFFLEQHRDALKVEDTHLNRLREHKPRRPHYMTRNTKKSGRFVASWNLIVPVEVFERQWQEVT